LSNKDASLVPLIIAGGAYLIIIGILTFVLRKIEDKFEYYR
jgi:polar amino acid transport system permease protein